MLHAVLWGLTSCQSPPNPLPTHFLKETIYAEDLVQSLTKRKAHLKDLRSFIRSTVSRKDFSQSLKQALLIKGSESIRIETLAVFGQSMGIFIHDKHKTVFYDPRNRQIIRGPELSEALERMFGAMLNINETIYYLTGNIPFLEDMKMVSVRLSSDKSRYILQARISNHLSRFHIELDAYTLLPKTLKKTYGNQVQYFVLK